MAAGIMRRTAEKPVAVVACENAKYATRTWYKSIAEAAGAHTDQIDAHAIFLNSVVDCIVPNQDASAAATDLTVRREAFFELVIERPTPSLSFDWLLRGVKFDDYEKHYDRKIYLVNLPHAAAAYLGFSKGLATIYDALQDDEIRGTIDCIVQEVALFLMCLYDFDVQELLAYADTNIRRFSVQQLDDKTSRVGRNPLRKLKKGERFLGPAAGLLEQGTVPHRLLEVFASGLRFQNVSSEIKKGSVTETEVDHESFELADILKSKNAEDATKHITGLDHTDPLYPHVLEKVKHAQLAAAAQPAAPLQPAPVVPQAALVRQAA
jgi:mannitol-1-phosphate 5-dehydrogenase